MSHNPNSLPVGFNSSSSLSSAQQNYVRVPQPTHEIPNTTSVYPTFTFANNGTNVRQLGVVSAYRDDLENSDDFSGSYDKLPLTVPSMTSQSTGTLSPVHHDTQPSYSVGMYNGVAFVDGRYNSDGNRIVSLTDNTMAPADTDTISIGSPVPLPFPSSAVALPSMHLQRGPYTQPTSALPSPYVDMSQLSLQEDIPLSLTLSGVYHKGMGTHEPVSLQVSRPLIPDSGMMPSQSIPNNSSTDQQQPVFAAIATVPTDTSTLHAFGSNTPTGLDPSKSVVISGTHMRSASHGYVMQNPSPALTARAPSDPTRVDRGQDSSLMRKRVLAMHNSGGDAGSSNPQANVHLMNSVDLSQRSSTPVLSYVNSNVSHVTVDSADGNTRMTLLLPQGVTAQPGQLMAVTMSGSYSPTSIVRVASHADSGIRRSGTNEHVSSPHAQNLYSQNVAADSFSFTSTPRSADKRRRTSYNNVLSVMRSDASISQRDGGSETEDKRSVGHFTPSSSPIPVSVSANGYYDGKNGMTVGDLTTQLNGNHGNFTFQSMQTQNMQMHVQNASMNHAFHTSCENSPRSDNGPSTPQLSPYASGPTSVALTQSNSGQGVGLSILPQAQGLSSANQSLSPASSVSAAASNATVHIAPFGACVVRPMLMNNGVVGQCVITPDGQVFVLNMIESASVSATNTPISTNETSPGDNNTGNNSSNNSKTPTAPTLAVNDTSAPAASADNARRGMYEVDHSSIDRKTNMFTQQSFMMQPFPVPLPQPAAFAAKQTMQVLTYRKPVMMSPQMLQSMREGKKEQTQNHMLPPAHPYQSVHSQIQQQSMQQTIPPFSANSVANSNNVSNNPAQAQLITAAAQQAAQVGADQQRLYAGRVGKARLLPQKSLSNHASNAPARTVGAAADATAPIIRGPDLEEAMRRKRNAKEKERRDYNTQLFEHLCQVLTSIGHPLTGQKSQMLILQHASATLEKLATLLRASRQREIVLEGVLNNFNIPIPDLDAFLSIGNHGASTGDAVENTAVASSNNAQVHPSQQQAYQQSMQMQQIQTPQQQQLQTQQQQLQTQHQVPSHQSHQLQNQQLTAQQLHLLQQLHEQQANNPQYAQLNNFVLADSNLLTVAGARVAVNANITAIADQLYGTTHITAEQQQQQQQQLQLQQQLQQQQQQQQLYHQQHQQLTSMASNSSNHMVARQVSPYPSSSHSTPPQSLTNTPLAAPSPMVDHSSCLPPSVCPTLPPLTLNLPPLDPLSVLSPVSSDMMIASPMGLEMPLDGAASTVGDGSSQGSQSTMSASSSAPNSTCSSTEVENKEGAAIFRGNSEFKISSDNGFPKLTFDQMRMLVTSLTPVNAVAAAAAAQGRDNRFPSSMPSTNTAASSSNTSHTHQFARPQPLITSITPTHDRSMSKLTSHANISRSSAVGHDVDDVKPSLCVSLSSMDGHGIKSMTIMPKVEEVLENHLPAIDASPNDMASTMMD